MDLQNTVQDAIASKAISYRVKWWKLAAKEAPPAAGVRNPNMLQPEWEH